MNNSQQRLLKFIFCIAFIAQTGCTAVVVGGAAAGGYLLGKDERTIQTITSDAMITSSVKSKLISDNEIKAFDINVNTYESKVTLIGHVMSSTLINRAISLAKSVEGVTGVKSHLIVIKTKK